MTDYIDLSAFPVEPPNFQRAIMQVIERLGSQQFTCYQLHQVVQGLPEYAHWHARGPAAYQQVVRDIFKNCPEFGLQRIRPGNGRQLAIYQRVVKGCKLVAV